MCKHSKIFSGFLYILSLFFIAGCQPQAQPESEIPTIILPAELQFSETGIDTNQESAEQIAARLQATFPAQQRAPGDAESIARGEIIFGINCRSCHGADLRGGDLGGPNLLRSQLVLNDQGGELIAPVVMEGRNNPGMTVMPPFDLPENDVSAVSAYIHSIVATSRGQGAPPPGSEIELNIVTGDAEAGREYFNLECLGCHSESGDMPGIVSQIGSPENLQNSWVAGRRWGSVNPDADPGVREVIVTITLSNGEEVVGKLGRIDDFLVSLTTTDGQYKSFSLHESTVPGVVSIERNDPMARHRALLSEYTDEIMHNVTAYLVTLL